MGRRAPARSRPAKRRDRARVICARKSVSGTSRGRAIAPCQKARLRPRNLSLGGAKCLCPNLLDDQLRHHVGAGRTARRRAPRPFFCTVCPYLKQSTRELSLAHSSSSCSRVTRASWNVSELCWRLSDSISVGLEDAMALHLRHSSDGGVCCDVCLNEQGNVYVILRRRSPPAPCEPPARQHREDRTSGPKGGVPGSQRAAAIAASTWRPRVHGRGPGS